MPETGFPGAAARPRPLLTVGHGTLEEPALLALLAGAEVASLVDVRRFPGSRRHPHVGRDALGRRLPEVGITYRWDERLGGRRPVPADSPDAVLRVAAFRGYAAHMRSAGFATAIDELLAAAATTRTAVMCSESVWWRCHRRLIADFVQLVRGVPVEHLMHDGRLTPHRPTDGARATPDGLLVYDAGADSLPWE